MKAQKYNISPYIVTWVEIKALWGIVPIHDQILFDSSFRFRHFKGLSAVYKHFKNRASALQWIETFNKKLVKSYVCRVFSDKQFGMAKVAPHGLIIPFTHKQYYDVYYI